MTLGIGAQSNLESSFCALWLADMEEEGVVVAVVTMGSIDTGLGWTRMASSSKLIDHLIDQSIVEEPPEQSRRSTPTRAQNFPRRRANSRRDGCWILGAGPSINQPRAEIL